MYIKHKNKRVIIIDSSRQLSSPLNSCFSRGGLQTTNQKYLYNDITCQLFKGRITKDFTFNRPKYRIVTDLCKVV